MTDEEVVAFKRAEYSRRDREKHGDARRAYCRAYYRKHRREILAAHKEWARVNRDANLTRRRAAYAAQKASNT